MPISRRQFLHISAGALIVGTAGDAFCEPMEIGVTQISISLARLPMAFDGLRVAQLSDIHFNPFESSNHVAKVVEKTNAVRPDLVVITGDFVSALTSGYRDDSRAERAWPCSKLLSKLQAPLGCFAVLGNHDYYSNPSIVSEAIESAGRIKVLRNLSEPVERNGSRLWITGIDNVTARAARPEEALQGIPPEECKIVAVHEPDFADQMRRYPVDLQLSGHSHGGQICAPLMGPIWLPPFARKYPTGHYVFGNYQLYTNRGIGMSGIPMRFLCPPEITLLTLKHA
jgi:hypothetical protein